jgi:uncharacterized membrane protein YkoI
MDVKMLPKEVKDYVAKNYAGYKIDEASKIKMADGSAIFEAEIEKGKEEMDLIFDEKGNFVKKEVENDSKEEKD